MGGGGEGGEWGLGGGGVGGGGGRGEAGTNVSLHWSQTRRVCQPPKTSNTLLVAGVPTLLTMPYTRTHVCHTFSVMLDDCMSDNLRCIRNYLELSETEAANVSVASKLQVMSATSNGFTNDEICVMLEAVCI